MHQCSFASSVLVKLLSAKKVWIQAETLKHLFDWLSKRYYGTKIENKDTAHSKCVISSSYYYTHNSVWNWPEVKCETRNQIMPASRSTAYSKLHVITSPVRGQKMRHYLGLGIFMIVILCSTIKLLLRMKKGIRI